MNRELLMNVHQTHAPTLLTVTDFVEWQGDGTDTRYELVDGVLRPMSPGSDAHNTIVMQLGRLIGNHLALALPSYRVVAAPGVQPHTRANWNYRIPDLGVTATPNRLGYLMTPDPILLIEVLSPGNSTDTFENVRAYATLPSVQEILVVYSTSIGAELVRRGPNGDWPPNPAMVSAGETLNLTSINASLPLDDIYAGTHLG
jgi:Uma2 family endonuclease